MGHTTDTIATLRGGAASRAVDKLLADVVSGVHDTGKKGSVTIKIEISKLKGGDTELEIKIGLAHKVPTEDIPMGIYYPGDNGTLHRTDPRQQRLEFDNSDGKVVDAASRRVGEGVRGDQL